MGLLIQRNYILTAASCIEIVGPNPIVVIGPYSIADDRWTQGVQEVRVEQADIHPKWTHKIEFGFDAALLKLPVGVDVQSPKLVSETFDLYPNSRIYGFHLRNTLQVAQFDVVGNEVCPQLEGLGTATFCAFSKWASMNSGDSGGPFFVESKPVLSEGPNSVYSREMQAAQIVGIASFANYSSLNKSATRGVLISDIHSWIEQITAQQEKYDLLIFHHLDDKQMMMAAAAALILPLAIAVWPQAILFFLVG